MRIGRGNRSTWRKLAPVPLRPPQNPRDLTWARTRAPQWEMLLPRPIGQLQGTLLVIWHVKRFLFAVVLPISTDCIYTC
jgi:hypothetical protein